MEGAEMRWSGRERCGCVRLITIEFPRRDVKERRDRVEEENRINIYIRPFTLLSRAKERRHNR